MVDRVLAEEQKRMDMEDKLARNALQAAEKVFEKKRSDALKLRDEIAKGPGSFEAGSQEAAKFMADQVNRSLAGNAVPDVGKPTEDQILEEARKQYELAVEEAKKTTEQTEILKKLLDKTQPIGKAR
jgi:preprotein translocase subunit SecA